MKMKKRVGRWGHLLEDPDVERWYENARRSSVGTASVYLRAHVRALGAAADAVEMPLGAVGGVLPEGMRPDGEAVEARVV